MTSVLRAEAALRAQGFPGHGLLATVALEPWSLKDLGNGLGHRSPQQ